MTLADRASRRTILAALAAGAGAFALRSVDALSQSPSPSPAPSPTAASVAPREPGLNVPAEVRAIEITARPIASFSRTGSGTRFGRLEYRGGFVMSSPAKGFGGLSGIVVEPDGRRVMMVSDEGAWFTGEIVYEAQRPTGIRNARMGPIRGVGGRQLDRKRDLDAESLALIDGNLTRGTVLIGFERNQRIGRFPILDGVLQAPAGYLKMPPEARRMRTNKGFEAATILQGGPHKGAAIAFSERFPDNPAQHTGWLWVKGEPQRLGFADIGEFEVTDVASLQDGTLLVLERRFRWTEGVKMRIRRFDPTEVRPGAVMQSDLLIEADMAFEIDNMESLAVHRGLRGEAILTLVSDDNFNSFLQRTILLQFALVDDGTAAARR